LFIKIPLLMAVALAVPENVVADSCLSQLHRPLNFKMLVAVFELF